MAARKSIAGKTGVPTIKPRNPVLVPSLKRKSGKHAPDPKGVRRESNQAAEREAQRLIDERKRDPDG